MSQLTALTQLYVGSNKLPSTEVDFIIESCPQLETLWVTECSLTTPLGIDKVNALVRYGSNRRSVLSALSIALIA